MKFQLDGITYQSTRRWSPCACDGVGDIGETHLPHHHRERSYLRSLKGGYSRSVFHLGNRELGHQASRIGGTKPIELLVASKKNPRGDALIKKVFIFRMSSDVRRLLPMQPPSTPVTELARITGMWVTKQHKPCGFPKSGNRWQTKTPSRPYTPPDISLAYMIHWIDGSS